MKGLDRLDGLSVEMPIAGGESETHAAALNSASRLDFHHLCNHAAQAKPGFYLILLRTEIRHRSLRDKPPLLPANGN
jgi:hypothetical protein